MRHGCFSIADHGRTGTSRKAERTGSCSQADVNRCNEAGTHGRGSVGRYEPCGVPERGLAQILERVGRQGTDAYLPRSVQYEQKHERERRLELDREGWRVL